MIDSALQPATESPVIREPLMLPSMRTTDIADLLEPLEPTVTEVHELAHEEFVQWGRCGLVPASLAHEPQD